ncbi:MAG: hypothetical protein ACLFV3_09160 [Phycisphaeraceae bacterium]
MGIKEMMDWSHQAHARIVVRRRLERKLGELPKAQQQALLEVAARAGEQALDTAENQQDVVNAVTEAVDAKLRELKLMPKPDEPAPAPAAGAEVGAEDDEGESGEGEDDGQGSGSGDGGETPTRDDRHIDALDLPASLAQVLAKAGLKTVGQVRAREDLTAIDGIAKASANRIRAALAALDGEDGEARDEGDGADGD